MNFYAGGLEFEPEMPTVRLPSSIAAFEVHGQTPLRAPHAPLPGGGTVSTN